LGIDFSLTNVSGSNDTHPSTHPNYSIDAVADASSSKLKSTENFTFSVRRALRSRELAMRSFSCDLFLSRFVPDPNWSSNLVNSLPNRDDVIRKLQEIEEDLCRQPGWIDHSTHILIIARPKL